MNKIVILINCSDKKGIIAAVTNYIASIEGNIIYLDQHVDGDQNVFFMRLECEFVLNNFNLDEIKNAISDKIEGAYFIHSAGFVNLSTDEERREKIFDENTKITKSIFTVFHPFIKKFMKSSTKFSISFNSSDSIKNINS